VNVLVYGGGAVGLGIASCLLKSKVRVDIVARPETVEALAGHGLMRDGIFGRFSAPPEAFGAYRSVSDIRGVRYDHILVCTKSFDTPQAALDLSRHPSIRHAGTVLVLCQNGWGNAEEFLKHFPKEVIYNARVITGFCRPEKNAVAVTVHAEPIHVGSLFSPDVSAVVVLCRAICEGGIPCQPTPTIEKDLWAKMLYNCALNPLGAVLGVPYGVLGRREETRAIMDSVVREIFAVMGSCGYRTHWTGPEGFLEVFYARLVPSTAAHESSMLQDIRAGRKTEIDALNGAVIRLAGRGGMPVPCNSMLYHLVKFAEGSGSPSRPSS
jgi:2-dehydropantoate 2-reductase